MGRLGRATCNVHSRPARKEFNLPKLNSSLKLNVLIYILYLWFIMNVCRVNFLAQILHENGSSFDSSLQSILSGSILFKVCWIETESSMGQFFCWLVFCSVLPLVLIVTLFSFWGIFWEFFGSFLERCNSTCSDKALAKLNDFLQMPQAKSCFSDSIFCNFCFADPKSEQNK